MKQSAEEVKYSGAREFWCRQMEEAVEMMDACRQLPVRECGEPLLDLRTAASAAGVRVAFSEKPLAPGISRIFRMRSGLVPKLMAAAEEMNRSGWTLRIEDGYRTVAMQRSLVYKPMIFDAIYRKTMWELNGQALNATIMLRRVTALVATCPKIGTHMSGSAVDISVLNADTGEELDRGGPYLEMSELTPIDSPFITAAARANRLIITDIMARHGFVAYPYEFWHYSQGDVYEDYLKDGPVARYGAVNLNEADGTVAPVPDPVAPLHSSEDIKAEIECAIRRARSGG